MTELALLGAVVLIVLAVAVNPRYLLSGVGCALHRVGQCH